MIPPMARPDHRVRRATQDDLVQLKELWSSMRLPADELGRQLTEFQVVEAADGKVAGALGIQILGAHGRIHSEGYRDFAFADDFRPALLERVRSLAANHGVFRLWTQEKAPFWTRNGFQPAGPDALKKLPEPWAGMGADWLTFQLKDETAIVSLEKELAMFMESEKERTSRALRQAEVIKKIATWVAVVLAVFVLGAIAYVFLKNPGMFFAKPGSRP
jgi:N-acetylglutamate synthase-like GNAT family acetyltransferase